MRHSASDVSSPLGGRLRRTSAHQRKAFSVKPLVGASAVVSPCIAVMGCVPAARNRVDLTTGGAAHDECRGNHGSLMPRGLAPTASLMSRLVLSGGDRHRVVVGAVGGGWCRGWR